MAPEVRAQPRGASGQAPVAGYDERCDTFSYGMLLWSLMHEVAVPPSSASRPPLSLSPDRAVYSDLITRCWQQDPGLRPSMQVVAAESKTRKDLAIASRVPALKRALEKFLWRCKVMFKNEPSFWMGNLKHKNLQGDQVCSQAYEEEASEEEEEEAPEESEVLDDTEAGLFLFGKEGVGEEEEESEGCQPSV